MSHDLDQTSGTAAFASVRLPAWHGLGIILPEHVSLPEMMKAAQVDYTVSLQNVVNANTGRVIEGFKATTRDSDGRTLGIVGNRYTILQNKEAFEIGEAILGEEATWETMGALNNGAEVFGLAKLNKDLYIAGDRISTYFLIATAHDGSKSLKLAVTPERVVCRNTLNMALRGTKRIVNIRHTPNYESRIAVAGQTLGLVKKYYETFEVQATNLVNKLFARAAFENLTKELFPVKDDASKREKTNAENEREKLLECWKAADISNVRDTAWGAFNAVADYSDHHTRSRGLEGRELAERNMMKAYDESDLKDRALALILAA